MVSSRTQPPAVYARLRLNEGLALLEGSELTLTRDEAEALAAARDTPGAALEPGRVAALLRESEGWVAGFTLLLAQGRGAIASGNARSRQLLFDYFTSELFERFDLAVQAALLRTALLPTMEVADAERLSGHPQIGRILADLRRRNCFCTQRGDREGVFEYHALFRTFLLERAAAFIPAPEWRALQQRAAELLLDAGNADAAASLYCAGSHWSGMVGLVLSQAEGLIAAGRYRTLQRWLEQIPRDAFAASAWLHYWQAMAWLPFDPARARSIFGLAYRGFEPEADANGLYSAWAGAMESFFYEWRDFRPADEWIAELATLRLRHPEFPSRSIELRTYTAMGTLLHRQPQHPILPAWSERALTLLDRTEPELSVLLGGYLIIFFMWRARTLDARSVIERIAPWIDDGMPAVVRILWSCAVGFFHSVQGETVPCRDATERGLTLAQDAGLHAFDHLLAAQMARCSLIAGDGVGAELWMSLMAAKLRDRSPIDGAFHRHLQANAAAQSGDWQTALDHGRAGLALALESGVPFLVAHCHIDLARVLLERGDHAEGREHLGAAFAIGRGMHSAVLEILGLEVEAVAALKSGQRVQERLARVLALSHAAGGGTWHMAGPQVTAALCDQALRESIEVEHVRRLIRRQGLVPPAGSHAAPDWPWPLRVHTLGRFEVLRDDAVLRAAGKTQRKPLELLQCLCAFGTDPVAQERVIDALWPEAEGDAGDQALRTTLHRLRKLLRHEHAVRFENRQLHLDPGCVWVDCVAFERATRLANRADAAALRDALQHYRGGFVPAESAPWAVAHRDHLRARFVRVAERWGSLLEHAGDWHGAVDCYLHAIEVEPRAETFYQRLMATYMRCGRRAEAIVVYQRCRLTLLSRLGVSPAAETQALHQQLIAA